jgi:hypothetical protein
MARLVRRVRVVNLEGMNSHGRLDTVQFFAPLLVASERAGEPAGQTK